MTKIYYLKFNALEEFLILGLAKSDGVSIERLKELSDNKIEEHINMQNINILKKEIFI